MKNLANRKNLLSNSKVKKRCFNNHNDEIMRICFKIFFSILTQTFLATQIIIAQDINIRENIDIYDIVWNSQSKDATGSMPLGGGKLGLNVWVENDDLLMYVGHPDSRLENQKLIKLGRIRIKLSPTPFKIKFEQHLELKLSCINLSGETEKGRAVNLKLWVDVYNPVVHVDIKSDEPINVEIAYESWFFDAYQINNGLEWIYRHDSTKNNLPQKIKNQKLEAIADKINDPLKNMTMGGRIIADGLVYNGYESSIYMNTPFSRWKSVTKKPVKNLDLRILVNVSNNESQSAWKTAVDELEVRTGNTSTTNFDKTSAWWSQFWDRSHIIINPEKSENDSAWQVGRNYQLYRYLLGCNSRGENPTLFNGGIFTFDNPMGDFSAFGASSPNPDERAWWDCLFMAQNQRLVYWPMIKSGDYDLLKIGLDFYRDRTELAKARSKHFFDVEGTPFPESIDIYGIMAACPSDSGHHGCEHLTYHYTSSLEFAFMMLENYRFFKKDIKESLPAIIGVLQFYDNYYQKESIKISGKPLDANGKLVIYPGNACEYGIGAKNHVDAISGLVALTRGLLKLDSKELTPEEIKWLNSFYERIPNMPIMQKNGYKYLPVAESFQKIGNPNEFTQLYALFPFHIYGVGMPNMEIALNTWQYGTDNDSIQKEFMCWKYSNIGTACLGLTDVAKNYAINKFLYPPIIPFMSAAYGDVGRFRARFPAFWVTYPFDHFPDMDHGGCSMIGLQEMLMQTPNDQIILLPAWPTEWDVDFKLHAPHQTIVEGSVKNGKIISIVITPELRRKDIVISPAFGLSKNDATIEND